MIDDKPKTSRTSQGQTGGINHRPGQPTSRCKRARLLLMAACTATATLAAQGTATAAVSDFVSTPMTQAQMKTELTRMYGALPYTGQTWGWPLIATGSPQPLTADQKYSLDRYLNYQANRSTFSDSLIAKCQDPDATCGFIGFKEANGDFPPLWTGSAGSVPTRTIWTTTTLTKSQTYKSGWDFSLSVSGSKSGTTAEGKAGFNTSQENSLTTASSVQETLTWQPNGVYSYPQLRLNGGNYTGYAFVKYWSSGFGVNPDPYGWNVAVKAVKASVIPAGQDSPATWFLVKS